MGDNRLDASDEKVAIIEAATALGSKYREMHEGDQALLNPRVFIEQVKRNYVDNDNNQQIQTKDMLAAIQYISELIDEINTCRKMQQAFRFTYSHLHRGRRCVDRLDRFRVKERKTGNKLIASGIARWVIFGLGFVGLVALSMFFPMVGGALLVGLASVMVFEFAFKKHWFKGPLHLATSASEKYKQGSLLKKHRVGLGLGLARLFTQLEHFSNRERPRKMHPFMGYLNKQKRPSRTQVETTYQYKIAKTREKLQHYNTLSEKLINAVAKREGLGYIDVPKYVERHAMQEPSIYGLYQAYAHGQEYYEARRLYLENSMAYAKKLLQKEADETQLTFDVSLSEAEKGIVIERIQANHAVLNKAFVARPNKTKFLQAFSFFSNPVNRSVYPEKYTLPDLSDHRGVVRTFPFERDKRYHNTYANKMKKN